MLFSPCRPRLTRALLLLVLPALLQATPVSPAPPSRAASLEEATARQGQQLYMAAFRGERTEEAVQDVEFQLASLERSLHRNAPKMAELLGYLGAMYLGASRVADAEATLERLYQFSLRGESEVLFYAGMRKMLGMAVFRKGKRRREFTLLEALLEKHRQGRVAEEHPERLGARMALAIEDCMATADMLDSNLTPALERYRRLLEQAEGVYRNYPELSEPPGEIPQEEVEEEKRRAIMDKEALTAAIRIFPLVGMLQCQLRMSELEPALTTSDLLVPLMEWLRKRNLLSEFHPARRAAVGALKLLGNLYTRYQKKVMAGTKTLVPTTLEERREWRRLEWKRQGGARVPAPRPRSHSHSHSHDSHSDDSHEDEAEVTLEDLPPGFPEALLHPESRPLPPPPPGAPPVPGGKLERLLREGRRTPPGK